MSYVSMRTLSGASSFAASSSAVLYEPFLLLPEIPSILILGFTWAVVFDIISIDKGTATRLVAIIRERLLLLRRRCPARTESRCRGRSGWSEGHRHFCAPFSGIEKDAC